MERKGTTRKQTQSNLGHKKQTQDPQSRQLAQQFIEWTKQFPDCPQVTVDELQAVIHGDEITNVLKFIMNEFVPLHQSSFDYIDCDDENTHTNKELSSLSESLETAEEEIDSFLELFCQQETNTEEALRESVRAETQAQLLNVYSDLLSMKENELKQTIESIQKLPFVKTEKYKDTEQVRLCTEYAYHKIMNKESLIDDNQFTEMINPLLSVSADVVFSTFVSFATEQKKRLSMTEWVRSPQTQNVIQETLLSILHAHENYEKPMSFEVDLAVNELAEKLFLAYQHHETQEGSNAVETLLDEEDQMLIQSFIDCTTLEKHSQEIIKELTEKTGLIDIDYSSLFESFLHPDKNDSLQRILQKLPETHRNVSLAVISNELSSVIENESANEIVAIKSREILNETIFTEADYQFNKTKAQVEENEAQLYEIGQLIVQEQERLEKLSTAILFPKPEEKSVFAQTGLQNKEKEMEIEKETGKETGIENEPLFAFSNIAKKYERSRTRIDSALVVNVDKTKQIISPYGLSSANHKNGVLSVCNQINENLNRFENIIQSNLSALDKLCHSLTFDFDFDSSRLGMMFQRSEDRMNPFRSHNDQFADIPSTVSKCLNRRTFSGLGLSQFCEKNSLLAKNEIQALDNTQNSLQMVAEMCECLHNNKESIQQMCSESESFSGQIASLSSNLSSDSTRHNEYLNDIQEIWSPAIEQTQQLISETESLLSTTREAMNDWWTQPGLQTSFPLRPKKKETFSFPLEEGDAEYEEKQRIDFTAIDRPLSEWLALVEHFEK